MKKQFTTLALAMILACSLAIPAGAVGTETPVVSEEQYQSYLDIANQVSEERGIEVTVCDRADMDTAYTDEEFANELEEFCDVIEALTDSSDVAPCSNPSEGGYGTKTDLRVNTSKNLDGGYFLFSITGTAKTEGTGPYTLGTASIAALTATKIPTDYSCTVKAGSTTTTVSSTVKTVQKNVDIYKKGEFMVTVTVQAKFTVNTSTGSITMSGSSWT